MNKRDFCYSKRFKIWRHLCWMIRYFSAKHHPKASTNFQFTLSPCLIKALHLLSTVMSAISSLFMLLNSRFDYELYIRIMHCNTERTVTLRNTGQGDAGLYSTT